MKIQGDAFNRVQPSTVTDKVKKTQSKMNNETEIYIPQRAENQRMTSIRNYSPNEVGMNSNVKTVSFRGSSLNTPNWDSIPTKGMKVPPQDVLISQIKALAEKSVRNTNLNAIEGFNLETFKLHAQYISSVSPDRKALHKQAMEAIKNFEAEKTKPLGEITLVYYLIKQDNILTETNQSIAAGGIVRPINNSLGGYDYDVIVGGITLLSSVNGQWLYGMTPAEEQKSDEFYKLYWSFVDEAKNELK